MANTQVAHTENSARAAGAKPLAYTRPFVGPSLLIEVSDLQRSSSYARLGTADFKENSDQDLTRFLAATTLCGLGLLILALIH